MLISFKLTDFDSATTAKIMRKNTKQSIILYQREICSKICNATYILSKYKQSEFKQSSSI